jgi:hypothetical protein
MKPIKVCVYKKPLPVYVKPEEVEESRQNCHLLIFNLTEQQKDEVLELLNKFGDIVTEIKTKQS